MSSLELTDPFDAFFEERLAPALARLHSIGRRYLTFMRWLLRILAVVALAWAGILYLRFPREKRWVIPPGAAVFLYFVIDSTFERFWKRRFKRQILAPALGVLQKEMRYEPDGAVPRETFLASCLFPLRVDRYVGEDHVRGRVEATRIELSELHARHCVKRWSPWKGIDKNAYVSIFRGFFFVADFNKDFLGTTLVLPESKSGQSVLFDVHTKALARENRRRRREPVLLEDPEFERLFAVHSDDQVEARYLLSPSFMERLKEHRRKGGDPLAVSFSASRIFVAIFTGRDLFVPVKPKELSELLEGGRARENLRRRLRQFLRDLDFGKDLVEELHLNTRIWTREVARDVPLPGIPA